MRSGSRVLIGWSEVGDPTSAYHSVWYRLLISAPFDVDMETWAQSSGVPERWKNVIYQTLVREAARASSSRLMPEIPSNTRFGLTDEVSDLIAYPSSYMSRRTPWASVDGSGWCRSG